MLAGAKLDHLWSWELPNVPFYRQESIDPRGCKMGHVPSPILVSDWLRTLRWPVRNFPVRPDRKQKVILKILRKSLEFRNFFQDDLSLDPTHIEHGQFIGCRYPPKLCPLHCQRTALTSTWPVTVFPNITGDKLIKERPWCQSVAGKVSQVPWITAELVDVNASSCCCNSYSVHYSTANTVWVQSLQHVQI